MTEKEFIEAASGAGYATKAQAKKWCEKQNREDFGESDFPEVFRFAEKAYMMRLDGAGYVAGHPRTTKRFKSFNSHDGGSL